MIRIKEKSLCSGCRACENICPKSCIKMYSDDYGFMFPQVEKENCIDCGLCEKVCPILNSDLNEIKDVFVGFSNKYNRDLGSSGGLFPEIAEYFLNENGIVYGSGFDETMKLKCFSIDSILDIKRLTKSKYLQSDMGDTYKKILKELKEGKKILFVSTPCYCQALKNYVGKEYENLYIVDFVCHGVPNQELFDKNMEWYRKKGLEIKTYDFRFNKHKINCSRVFFIETKLKNIVGTFLDDPYYYYYYCTNYIAIRESCFNCKFAISLRCSDITIGDFHNAKYLGKEKERLKGFSSVLINTKKGLEIIENIKNSLETISIDREVVIKNNANLCCPTKKPKNTDEFREDYKNLSYELLMKKYGFYSLKTRIKRNYYRLPKVIQILIRKILIKEEI